MGTDSESSERSARRLDQDGEGCYTVAEWKVNEYTHILGEVERNVHIN